MDSDDSVNQRTIDSYNSNHQKYILGTSQQVTGSEKGWLDTAVSGLQKSARILEIGSASGRDAEYIEGLGYSVECTDAARSFVDVLKHRGHDARTLNIVEDSLPENTYDFVLANAVVLHFTRSEVRDVVKKVFNTLTKGGKFAFSLIEGEGDKWWDGKIGAPRYFCYWKEDEIKQLLGETGFSESVISSEILGNRKWLNLIASK